MLQGCVYANYQFIVEYMEFILWKVAPSFPGHIIKSKEARESPQLHPRGVSDSSCYANGLSVVLRLPGDQRTRLGIPNSRSPGRAFVTVSGFVVLFATGAEVGVGFDQDCPNFVSLVNSQPPPAMVKRWS
jgi:hypothetical protein